MAVAHVVNQLTEIATITNCINQSIDMKNFQAGLILVSVTSGGSGESRKHNTDILTYRVNPVFIHLTFNPCFVLHRLLGELSGTFDAKSSSILTGLCSLLLGRKCAVGQ